MCVALGFRVSVCAMMASSMAVRRTYCVWLIGASVESEHELSRDIMCSSVWFSGQLEQAAQKVKLLIISISPPPPRPPPPPPPNLHEISGWCSSLSRCILLHQPRP